MKLDAYTKKCAMCNKVASYDDNASVFCARCADAVEHQRWNIECSEEGIGWNVKASKTGAREFEEMDEDYECLVKKHEKLKDEFDQAMKIIDEAKRIVKLAEFAKKVGEDAQKLKDFIKRYGELEIGLDAATDKVLSDATSLFNDEAITGAVREGVFE